jgi:hypothetical protein
MRFMDDTLYVVTGAGLYAIDSDLNSQFIGTITGEGNVLMSDNGTHVVVVTFNQNTDAAVYAANLSGITTLTQSNMNGVTYQDGYIIYTQADTERFWISGLDDATTIDPLDFSTADALPDDVVGCVSNARELWIFGSVSTEVYTNTGDSDFPFERTQGTTVTRGCGSSGSIATEGGRVYWLGDDRSIYASEGYTPGRISPPWIDAMIASDDSPENSFAFIYTQQGHTFYVLLFDSMTICFDITTGMWHTRKSQNIFRWRANAYASAWGMGLVGDYVDGKIYELGLSTYSDNGDEIERMAVSQPIDAGGNRAVMHNIIIDMATGVGLTSGQGSDPLVMLDWSDDGGHNWSNERMASAGKIGEYDHRVIFTRLGSFRSRSVRVRITDPIQVAILGAYATLEGRE